MSRASFPLRRTGSAWLLVSCLMLSVFLTIALASALLTFYSTSLPAAMTQELTESGTLSVIITGQTSGSPVRISTLVGAKMRAAFGPVPIRIDRAMWSNELALPNRHAVGGNISGLQAAAITDISKYADLSAGTWPAPPRAGRPLPVALPVTAAADLHLRIGSTLRLHYLSGTSSVALRVTGLFRPRDPAAAYWQVDLIGSSGLLVSGGFATYGPAVVNPAAFGTGALAASTTSFVVVPSLAAIHPGDLVPLATRLAPAIATLLNDVSTVSSNIPQTLLNLAQGLAAAKALVVISALQLLLLGAVALALAGRLLASHRDEESALLAARGAARWQLARSSLAEGLVVGALAAAPGALAGVRLAGLLLANLLGRHLPQPPVDGEIWVAAAVVLLLYLGIILWPALRPPGIATVRIRRGRQVAVVTASAAGADVAIIGLALLAVHELLSYSAAGGAGIDPVIAAPALALAGLALIPLRVLPVAAKGLEKLTARGRRLGTAMANWEISRRPVRQSGPALLLILAVGTSTLALGQYQSWRQSLEDQAAFVAGAPVRVELATPEPLSRVTQLTRLRGVIAAMAVSRQSFGTSQLLVIGARQAAATVTMRPDLSPQYPVSGLWGVLDQGGLPGVAVPGRPYRLAVTARMSGGPGDQLGPVAATLTVQDAYGLAYSVPDGMMPADDRPHQLIADLATAAGIAYPLRILGVSLTYNMPTATASARAGATHATAMVRFSAIAASDASAGPFAPPFATGRALTGWRPRTSGYGLDNISHLLRGQTYGSKQPSVLHWGAVGQVAELQLDPGIGPALQPSMAAQLGVTSLPAQVQVTIPATAGIPVIATNGYLAAAGLTTTSVLQLGIAGTEVSADVLLPVSQFPTVTSGSAVVADQAAVQDALVSAGGAPLAATSWWLRTVSGKPPSGLPAGATVVDAASLSDAMQHNPLSAAPIKAALAVGAAAAVLAALGFCVSVAASARARRGQRAVLGTLGVPAGAQARLFCLEEAMVSAPAALIGLALGAGLAHLLIPAMTLTATAGLPVPPVLVRLPLLWLVLIVVAMPAIPVLAAAVTTAMQPDPAAALRAAEGA